VRGNVDEKEGGAQRKGVRVRWGTLSSLVIMNKV
jgi:hypothetical protein